MNYPRIIHLLIRGFKNQLSREESRVLNEWTEAEDHRTLAKEMEELWEVSAQYKSNYQPDVEKGLDRLQNRIRADREKNRPRRLRSWLPAIAAAFLLLLGGWYWLLYLPGAATGASLITTGASERQVIDLPDGSVAHLSEHSRLEYPRQWSVGEAFELTLRGEAFFEVAPHHASRAFIVRTPETEVRVLGTAFNVRAYPNEATTEVTVDHGKVAFAMRREQQQLVLDENDRGICEHGNRLVHVEDAGINPRPWAEGVLEFRNTPMKEVVRDLEHYFGLQFQLDNPEFGNCKFTNPAIRKEDLDHIIQNLELVFGARVLRKGPDSFIIRGGSCSEE